VHPVSTPACEVFVLGGHQTDFARNYAKEGLEDIARIVGWGHRAGPIQVGGARTFATLNIGGSTATTVSFVVSTA
jgi:hypothetical protein